jgi:hypothetical protein
MERLRRHALFAVAAGLVPLLGFQLQPGTAAAAGHQGQQRPCIFDHQSLWSAPGTCRPRAKAYPSQVATAVQKSIYDGAVTFGLPYRILLKIARCESGLNPKATNGTHFGLYQFAPETFRRAVTDMLGQTGVQATTYWSALDSAYAAGYLFATGASRSWSCEKLASPPPLP